MSITEAKKEDFEQVDCTAIISDLHLADCEPDRPEGDLWKKFKRKEFFIDEDLYGFLQHIQEQAQGRSLELILNGDIFDFDSVVKLPDYATYRITWLEKSRGLFPEEEKARFKIKTVLEEHEEFVLALREFVQNGNRVVFVIGNHDLELHYPSVQAEIHTALNLKEDEKQRVRFCEWFYISNKDTLVEHGNQYDPYCVCQNPINPLIQKFNRIEIRIPFGDLATRYLINGMGFFNPHVDTNFIMSFKDYLKFFSKYLVRSQPLIMVTWFWSSILILMQASLDRLLPELKDPLTVEDRVNEIASKSNATPRMVREMKELTVNPAASNPLRLARELWLDRAFIVLITFILLFQVFIILKATFGWSLFWMFIPLFLMMPFFIFYAKSIISDVSSVKEPSEWILSVSSQITGVKRVVYGHTHVARHEMYGNIEHLNSGCWSPAFLDVECTKPFGKKTYVWIEPLNGAETRKAELREFVRGESYKLRKGVQNTDPHKIEVSS